MRFTMENLKQMRFVGERALYGKKDIVVTDSVFDDGESPLKECGNVELVNCRFGWKYPLWYCNNVTASDCSFLAGSRAGIWYTNNIKITDSLIAAPKDFRRCNGITLKNVFIPNAQETLWNCSSVTIDKADIKGDYLAMNCSDMTIDNLSLEGNYAFDGCKNLTIRNSRMLTKDAFWNTENVKVYDSYICGEYLGWNSKDITLVNCTIESLQGMCYIDDLKLINCKLVNTTLAFEYSNIKADVRSHIDSVFNPLSGTITAESIGELILEKDKVDKDKTNINCKEIHRVSERPDWIPS